MVWPHDIRYFVHTLRIDCDSLDASEHVHLYMLAMHKFKIIMDHNDGTRCTCTTNYNSTYVRFVQNIAHVRF